MIKHLIDYANPHKVTKAQVGLGNCDNTADADKAVKSATTATTATSASKLTTARKIELSGAVTELLKKFVNPQYLLVL